MTVGVFAGAIRVVAAGAFVSASAFGLLNSVLTSHILESLSYFFDYNMLLV